MLSKIGLTRVKNWFLTTESFCSNNNLIETAEISFLACNNKRLTLILLRAVSLTCKVLFPQILTPSDAKVVIGLILLSYKVSLSSWVNLTLALIQLTSPLWIPATANHGKATLSVNAIFLTTSLVGGI